MPTLHIHLDESGDLNFSPSGSKYYVFAAAWTYDPAPLAHALTDLRFSLLRKGEDIQAFHAHEDKQANRDAVVDILVGQDNFYPRFASMVLRFVLRGRVMPGTENILVFTDALPIKKRKELTEKAIKTVCRAELDQNMRSA